jgi:hypothetical protein
MSFLSGVHGINNKHFFLINNFALFFAKSICGFPKIGKSNYVLAKLVTQGPTKWS